MFTFMGYCGVHLINSIRTVVNNLSFLMTMHEAPIDKITQSDNDTSNDRNISNMDSNKILILEDDSQINENDLIENPIEGNSNILCCLPNQDSPSPKQDVFLKSIQLNDTLEEVEFMMEQGLKILNNTECDATNRKPNKKSTFTPKYDYVKSPISAYIKYSPLAPLRRNNNNNTMPHQRIRCLETLGESTIIYDDNNDNKQTEIVAPEKRCTFPRKAYINSARKQIIYENVLHRKDGVKMQKWLGDLKKSPTIIKHYGRLRTKTLSQRKENIPIDDTFNDFSIDYNDISLHIVSTAKQN